MAMPGPIDQRLAARMGGGPPGPMPGPGPPPGGPGMGQPGMGMGPPGMGMGGGDVRGKVQQLLGEALLLTKQAGPEAFIRDGLGDLWKGAFAVLDKGLAPLRQQMIGGQQGAQPGPPMGGAPMGAPPMAGAAPMPMR